MITWDADRSNCWIAFVSGAAALYFKGQAIFQSFAVTVQP
jgi:hypothetical protein